MGDTDVLPELKAILGAMIFGANRPLDVKEMRQCLVDVAKAVGGETAAFGEVKESDVLQALEYVREDLEQRKCGFVIAEVAGGYRFQSSAACGRWLRHLLNMERPNRLSQPGLETLAIIAYRQPVSKSEIEGVRGVNVDHIIKSLLEMQLVRIVGRSDLAGRPFLFGTTQTFLEHFGLKDLNDLKLMDPMLLRERERKRVEQRLAETAGGQESGDKAQAAGTPLAAACAETAGQGADAAREADKAKAGESGAEPAESTSGEEGKVKGDEVDEDMEEDDEFEDEEDEGDEDDDDAEDEEEDA